jgi:pimeloyl-ACP methyl ester carboxylesterase
MLNPNPHVEEIDQDRRRFFKTTAMTVAASQLGWFASARAESSLVPPQAGGGTHTSFAALKQIDAGLLNVGYAEAGPASGPAVILLHGWPYDIYSFVDVAPVLAAAGYHVIVPWLRGYGSTTFLSSDTMRNAQQSAVGLDILALMDALRIQTAIVGGFDWGARTADVMATLWPERCKGIVSVSGYLIRTPAGIRRRCHRSLRFCFGINIISRHRWAKPAMQRTSINSTNSSGTRHRRNGISTMPPMSVRRQHLRIRITWTS